MRAYLKLPFGMNWPYHMVHMTWTIWYEVVHDIKCFIVWSSPWYEVVNDMKLSMVLYEVLSMKHFMVWSDYRYEVTPGMKWLGTILMFPNALFPISNSMFPISDVCFQYTNYVSKRLFMFPISNLCFQYPMYVSKWKWCFQTTMFPMYVSNIHRAHEWVWCFNKSMQIF